jgi:hypothetical protein
MREENEIKHIELYTKFIERYRNDIQKEKVERRDRKIDEILNTKFNFINIKNKNPSIMMGFYLYSLSLSL